MHYFPHSAPAPLLTPLLAPLLLHHALRSRPTPHSAPAPLRTQLPLHFSLRSRSTPNFAPAPLLTSLTLHFHFVPVSVQPLRILFLSPSLLLFAAKFFTNAPLITSLPLQTPRFRSKLLDPAPNPSLPLQTPRFRSKPPRSIIFLSIFVCNILRNLS